MAHQDTSLWSQGNHSERVNRINGTANELEILEKLS